MKYFDIELMQESNLLFKSCYVVLYGNGFKGRLIKERFEAIGLSIWKCCDRDAGKTENDAFCVSPVELANQVNDILDRPGEQYVYIIACIERSEEAWDCLNPTIRSDKARFISYWGIEQWFYQNRDVDSFSRNRILKDKYDIENASRRLQCELYFQNWLLTVLDSKDCIWNVQPGKTASMSIDKMLKTAGIKTIHGHRIAYPRNAISYFEEEWSRVFDYRKQNPIRIVCFVRNPLDRDYSAFWEPWNHAGVRKEVFSGEKSIQERYDEFINDAIIENKVDEKYGVYRPFVWQDEFRWFDVEIKEGLGIDVYSYQFDREKGFGTIEKDNVSIFVGKLENIDSLLGKLGEFVGAKLVLPYENTATNKQSSMIYKEFRSKVKISRRYIDYYFNNNVKVDHFYTKEEQESFVRKWKDSIIE